MKKRILIIDDDEDLLSVMKDRLKIHDFLCSALSEPDKVVERALHWKPHLILLDLGLPKISGMGLLREIKNHPELTRIPVVILSGFADTEVVQEVLDLGAAGYLNKTCGTREIVSTVSQYAL